MTTAIQTEQIMNQGNEEKNTPASRASSPRPAQATGYVTSRETCEANIKGVCEGCGGALTAIETVDNSGNPTFWQGCEHCSCFRSGIERKYFEIARTLVENGELRPYSHMNQRDYDDSPERQAYYLDSQTAGLSPRIRKIDLLLTEARTFPLEADGSALEIVKAAIAWKEAWGVLWDGDDSPLAQTNLNDASKSLYDAVCDHERGDSSLLRRKCREDFNVGAYIDQD